MNSEQTIPPSMAARANFETVLIRCCRLNYSASSGSTWKRTSTREGKLLGGGVVIFLVLAMANCTDSSHLVWPDFFFQEEPVITPVLSTVTSTSATLVWLSMSLGRSQFNCSAFSISPL